MLIQRLGMLVMLAAACSALVSGCAPSDSKSATAPSPSDTTTTMKSDTVALVFDLRFKGVGVLSGLHGGIGSAIDFPLGKGFPNYSGSPLSIGNDVCAPHVPIYGCFWAYTTYPLPANDTGLVTWYIGDYWANIGSYFQDSLPSDTVITSVDLQPSDSIFAFSEYVTSAQGGYTLGVHTVAPSMLQAAASQEGSQRRIITALSFLNGQIQYFSYAWQHDTNPAGYDAQVAAATTIDSVPTAAQALASGGYTITAFGGDSADGFVLVGTRIHGVTTLRSLMIVPNSRAGVPGYATVAFLADPQTTYTVIAER
jgi:hypothetical protein